MIFEAYDVVTVPFPFADRQRGIVRPALILTGHGSFGQHSAIAIVAMITSAKQSSWPFDVPITDLDSAGLSIPCLVRQKLNSVALALVERKIGTLADVDRKPVGTAVRHLLKDVI